MTTYRVINTGSQRSVFVGTVEAQDAETALEIAQQQYADHDDKDCNISVEPAANSPMALVRAHLSNEAITLEEMDTLQLIINDTPHLCPTGRGAFGGMTVDVSRPLAALTAIPAGAIVRIVVEGEGAEGEALASGLFEELSRNYGAGDNGHQYDAYRDQYWSQGDPVTAGELRNALMAFVVA